MFPHQDHITRLDLPVISDTAVVDVLGAENIVVPLVALPTRLAGD